METDAGWTAAPKGESGHRAESPRRENQPASEQIYIARQAPFAFISLSREGNPPAVRVELLDLAAGISTGSFLLSPNSFVEDVSPDGKCVLVHGEDQKGRLEIWTINAQRTGAARTLITFPYSADDHGRDVDWALFTDSGHVAILNFGSKLTVFDTATAKISWIAMVEGGYRPKISPGGKYALIRTRDAAYNYREPTVIECATGKPIGMLDPGPVSDDPPLSFNSVAAWTPSGGRIAMMDDHNVRVWDTAAGKPMDLFGLPVGSRVWNGPAFAFTTETDALLAVEGQTLIDFKRRIPLWQYEPLHDSIVKVAADGRCWYTLFDAGAREYFLIGAELPDRQAAARAAELDPVSLLLLRPNSKVSVTVDLPAPPETQKHIQELLVKKLAERNITVADGQDVVVKALIEVGQPQQAVYTRLGGGPRETKRVSYTMKTSKIVVEFNGAVAWQTFRFDAPGNRIQLQPGESIDRAIARVSRPDYAFFDRAEIPAYVARAHTPMCYGNSKLAPADDSPAPPVQASAVPAASHNAPPAAAPVVPPPVSPPAASPPTVSPPPVSAPAQPVNPKVSQSPAPANPVQPPQTDLSQLAGHYTLAQMPVQGVNRNPLPGGDVILNSGRISTPHEIKVPFRVDVQVKTDSTNIRLGFARGLVIFNWELNRTELRHHDPITGKITAIKDKGAVPIDEFVKITWIVTEESSRVLVNDEERALIKGDYHDKHGLLSIFPAGRSTITIKSVSVTSPATK